MASAMVSAKETWMPVVRRKIFSSQILFCTWTQAVEWSRISSSSSWKTKALVPASALEFMEERNG